VACVGQPIGSKQPSNAAADDHDVGQRDTLLQGRLWRPLFMLMGVRFSTILL